MNIFDIIGPVMIGPSSSHTAGVVRIGNIVHRMLGGDPSRIAVHFYGSFAKTYAGHGSDKAIIGGLLGFTTEDERIRGSLQIARERGIPFAFETTAQSPGHPNSLTVTATSENGVTVRVLGESIGGGSIVIRKINDIDVAFDGQYDTLIIRHIDSPGVIAATAGAISAAHMNIAQMRVFRAAKGGEAIMIIETDGVLPPGIADAIQALPRVIQVDAIPGMHAPDAAIAKTNGGDTA